MTHCITSDELTDLVVSIFTAAGVSAVEAVQVAESLVDANLRGHDSHGVVRVPQYIRQLREGALVAGAELVVSNETDAAIVADACYGFGQVQMRRLIELLTPKARRLGVACGTLIRCGHVGRLGEWVEQAARDGLAGLISVTDNGVLQCVAPPGGVDPRISTNPLAIAAPGDGEPLALDISTSAVANGKLRVAQLAGKQCPEGWLQDGEGRPTTDPFAREADPPGTILPMGGDQGYKGFGLGLLLDVLVCGLSGGFCPPATPEAKLCNNVLLVLWNPARFAGEAHFAAQLRALIDYTRSSRLKPGTDRIRLPGDRSLETLKRRRAEGIPLDDGTWKELQALVGGENGP